MSLADVFPADHGDLTAARAEVARLREALEWLRPRVDGDELDHIDAALAAKEADRG